MTPESIEELQRISEDIEYAIENIENDHISEGLANLDDAKRFIKEIMEKELKMVKVTISAE